MAEEVIALGLCMVVERTDRGFLRFGIDRLGGDEGGGSLPFSLHPYGFRSRPRAPTKTNDDAIEGADLLLFDFGGSNEGALPGQDGRVDVPDEGDGGAVLYGWTGSGAPSYVLVRGLDGKVIVSAPETIIGAEEQVRALVTDALLTWITGTLLPALANAPGGSIVVTPPASVTTTKVRAQ